MRSLTVYELAGEDMDIEVKLLYAEQVEITIRDENEEIVYKETSHKSAWDSLAYFARQVVHYDNKFTREGSLIDED